MGVIATGTHHIPDDMFLIAAQELANFVDQADLDRGSLYPPLNTIQEISMRIAMGVTKCAYDKGNTKKFIINLYVEHYKNISINFQVLPQPIPNQVINANGYRINYITSIMKVHCP